MKKKGFLTVIFLSLSILLLPWNALAGNVIKIGLITPLSAVKKFRP